MNALKESLKANIFFTKEMKKTGTSPLSLMVLLIHLDV